MQTCYSYLFNAVILPITPASQPGGQRFQVSASRNDRDVPRYISPGWTLAELLTALASAGLSQAESQELIRGNRRGAGAREARRILFTAEQLESIGLRPDVPDAHAAVPPETPSAGEHAVFPTVEEPATAVSATARV